MTEIIPAILAKDINDLKSKLGRFVNISKTVQIDVCDGKFVPTYSWPMNAGDRKEILNILNEDEGMPFWNYFDFEFDLMVKNSIEHFEFFTRLGAKRIVFHLEAEDSDKLKEFIESMDTYVRENLEIGLSIKNDMGVKKLDKFINIIDFIQLMGIKEIGYQGEPFDERVLGKIKEIKEKDKNIIISIDGSVNEDTANLLVKAGADRLVVGSYLDRRLDIVETIKELENLD